MPVVRSNGMFLFVFNVVVCLFVCLFVCLVVCLFACLFMFGSVAVRVILHVAWSWTVGRVFAGR